MLNEIDGPATSAKSEELGELNDNDLPAPRNLRIKKDAKVMFIKNDSEGRWVNGTIGVVTNCSDKKGTQIGSLFRSEGGKPRKRLKAQVYLHVLIGNPAGLSYRPPKQIASTNTLRAMVFNFVKHHFQMMANHLSRPPL